MTVAQFISILNQMFTDMPEFAVEGEIVSMKFSKGNAVFIELKDLKEQAVIRVSNFAPFVEGLKQVSEGMHVVVYGRPDIYPNYGSLTFKVRKIEPVGAGALKQAFENLKRALEEEGLFASERKRELPRVITRIALITGKDSAAYADFTKILRESGQSFELEFFPVLVQGPRSEKEVVAALNYNAKRHDIDVIALVRGGGSLEDLASFNSESVARTIFASKIPVVVGVGHEVDTSIADLVADVRASTPSQAAYYLAARNQQFLETVAVYTQRIESEVRSLIPTPQSIDSVLAYWQMRLHKYIPAVAEIINIERGLQMGLGQVTQKIRQERATAERFYDKGQNIINLIQRKQLHLANYQNLLAAYNPKNTLKRGYTLIQQQGKYISRNAKLVAKKPITIHFYDGKLEVERI